MFKKLFCCAGRAARGFSGVCLCFLGGIRYFIMKRRRSTDRKVREIYKRINSCKPPTTLKSGTHPTPESTPETVSNSESAASFASEVQPTAPIPIPIPKPILKNRRIPVVRKTEIDQTQEETKKFPLSKMRRGELLKMCTDMDLDKTGTVEVLRKRVKEATQAKKLKQ